MEQVFSDIACTLCGCVCDDLRLTVREGRIRRAEGACSLAEPWFLGLHKRQPPPAAIEGQAADWEAAVSRAATLLRGARYPLIYGLSRSSTPGQRAAIRLADRLGATIDTTASRCHAPSIVALQQCGESTCTLGEARNRADLVVFWGADPVRSHPRHLERYSADPAGQFVPGGRAGRTLVVVDVRETETTRQADFFLRVPPGSDFDVLWSLRMLVRRMGAPPSPAGVAAARLEDLAERMRTCRFGVVFFGTGLTRQGLPHAAVEALLRLVIDLNAHTRFHARRLRIPGDVAGADSVLCWQTGFPFSVNLARGYPRYNPGEYSANEVLARGEADACLLVGSEGTAGLSADAVQRLREIPRIVLDYPHVESPIPATVSFTTAVYGIHVPGTAYRMDEVPIPLRAVLPAEYPDDARVLSAILARIVPGSA